MANVGRASRVIVTRPADDAKAWVARLAHHEFNAQALPLIDIAPVSRQADVSAVLQAVAHLSDYSAVMFVSANAVKHFFDLVFCSNVPVADINIAQAAIKIIANRVPEQTRFLAPGPGTVAALLAAGIPLAQIDAPPPDAAQFDSEALWHVVGQRLWHAAKVLVVRGQGDAADGPQGTGRNWLAQQWRASGAAVDVVSSYERRAPFLSAAQIDLAKAASCDGSVWLFSSSEAVANLVCQPGLQDVSWQSARAIATHPRIQAAVQAARWGVVQASRPGLPDLIEALASIESTPS